MADKPVKCRPTFPLEKPHFTDCVRLLARLGAEADTEFDGKYSS